MSALLNRILAEEAAKQKQCACAGCTNQATHTWSGHPTCDRCAMPASQRYKNWLAKQPVVVLAGRSRKYNEWKRKYKDE